MTAVLSACGGGDARVGDAGANRVGVDAPRDADGTSGVVARRSNGRIGIVATTTHDGYSCPSRLPVVSCSPNGRYRYEAKLLLLRADGGATKRARWVIGYHEAVSPGATKLAFSIVDRKVQREPTPRVWVTDRDGGRAHVMGFGERPAWSPDGRRIAFTRASGTVDDNVQDVVVMNADGTKVKPLTDRTSADALDFTPDGQSIVFAQRWFPANRGLYVIAANGGTPRPIYTNRSVAIVGLDVSPDGRRILFVTQRGDDRYVDGTKSGSLYVIDADGEHRKRLVKGVLGAVWSPDGRQIAYTTRLPRHRPSSKRLGLWVMGGDDDHRRLLRAFRETSKIGPERMTSYGWTPLWLPGP